MNNKITRENYAEVLDSIRTKAESLPDSEIEFVNSVFKKLRSHIVEIRKNADELLHDNDVLRIGVVGQVKAGKSSFLNSLLFDGESVLPKAATPMTAGLTVLEYGEENEFIVEYYDSTEWRLLEDRAKEYDEIIQINHQADPKKSIAEIETEIGMNDELKSAKELVSSCKFSVRSKITDKGTSEHVVFRDLDDMRRQLAEYVGADGKYTPIVKALTIKLKDENLKQMQIVDTPGVNDPIVSREERTRQFLASCHGVLFLSYSGRFFDSTDVDFLVRRVGGQGIGSVVVVASKYDSVLQDEGNKFRGDLEGADEHCSKGLRKQMERNIRESDYEGNMPRMTVSSGIGYSIATKPRDRWDITERHVAERMKEYYPEEFSDDETLRKTFLLLSQINEIREDFVENEFLKKKDEIIEGKMNRFFSSISGQLRDEVSEGSSKVKGWIMQLEEGDINTLEIRKKAINSGIDVLNRKLNLYTGRFEAQLEDYRRKLFNIVAALSSPHIVTHEKFGDFQRESTFLGRTKKFIQPYKEVDIPSTKSKGMQVLNNILGKLSQQWEECVRSVRNNLFNEIDEIIRDLESKDKEGNLDADILRDLSREAFYSMGGQSTFDIKGITEKAGHSLAERCNNAGSIPYKFGCMEEIDAKNQVKKEADKIINNLESSLSKWVTETSEDIEQQIRKEIDDLRQILTSRKEEMIRVTREKTSETLSGLESELKNKERNLFVYKEAYAGLNSILQLL